MWNASKTRKEPPSHALIMITGVLLVMMESAVAGANTSRLYGNAGEEILDTLANTPSTSNFHIKCLTPENFTASGLDQFYDIAATSEDDNGLTFIASMEAKNYPIWGVQFHPEKNMYEWRQTSIPHSAPAVAVGQYFANFFVNEGWFID